MRFEEIASDVLMFVGDAHESVATAFVNDKEVLLVDSLGSLADAAWMQRVLREDRGATVRTIAATHYMSDHMAGASHFPHATVIAHRHHRHAFLSQNRRVDAFWRRPDMEFDNLTVRWGRHELRFRHNPGKTMDHVSVDVPTADLVCVGDGIVGNIVYVSRADPVLMRSAVGQMKQFGRKTIVGGHMGAFEAVVLDNAIHYLDSLQRAVVAIRVECDPPDVDQRIASIPIEHCLGPGVEATTFERVWHGHNLEAIQSQSIFALDASLAQLESST